MWPHITVTDFVSLDNILLCDKKTETKLIGTKFIITKIRQKIFGTKNKFNVRQFGRKQNVNLCYKYFCEKPILMTKKRL